MSKVFKKLLSLVLCLIMMLGIFSTGINTITADAAAFSPRLTAPSYSTYYKPQSSYNPFEVNYNAYGGNCTWYAWGRAYEITGSYPKLGTSNAGTWWGYNKNGGYYSYGSTPKLGSVACWSNSSAGHVGVVEQINSDGTIVISESGWNSCYFRTVTIPSSGYRSGLNFQGYIYLGNYSIEKPQITNIASNINGTVTLSWNKCPNASYYSIRFFKVGESTEYRFLSWITKDTTYTYELPDGTYTAYITAESSNGWTHGDMSSSFKIERKTPSKPTITSISTNNNTVTLSWTASDKTDYYSIRFFKAGESTEYKFLSWITKDTTYSYELPDGTYTAYVTAENNDGWTHSDMSGTFTITHEKPSKPTITYIGSNPDGTVTLNWSSCEQTKYYDIRFFEAGKSQEFAFILGSTSDTTYTYALPDGNYTSYITAVNEYGWTHGDMSSTFHVERKAPSQPSITNVITEKDGSVYLEWTACDRAKSYSIRFFKVGDTNEYLFLQGITSNTSYKYKLSDGSYTAYVTAEGGDYWTHSEMTGVFVISTTSYKVTYNANGGLNSPNDQTKEHNIDLILNSTVPTRSGCTFLGWSKNSNATSVDYYPSDVYSENKDVTLYAVWQKNTVTTTYTLSYNANGGSSAPSSQTGATCYTVSSAKPIRNGYTFLGWSKSSSATSASYVAGNTITISANTTLYAVWKKTSQGSTNKCPYCNNIFTSESEYNKHLANCDGFFNNNDNIKVTIRNNPGTITLNYGDTVRIYADAENLPAGAKIGWYVNDGSTIKAKVSSDNTYCDITATGSGTVTLAAKAVDANGNVMTNSQGNQIADIQKINTKSSIWLMIVSFFKNLFGMNRTTVQFYKSVF